jgi:ATP-dependent DNA ligase
VISQSAVRELRPQAFGRRSWRHIDDPLVEPLWIGRRVLAHVASGLAELVDEEGERVDAGGTIDAVAQALVANSAVIDGYLTVQALQQTEGVFTGQTVEAATPGQMARQMLLGDSRNRRKELADAAESALPVPEFAEIDPAFVAIDLLVLDDESLLDVPLLERKRLLDSVFQPSRLTRLGIHVRPPVGPWLATWRAAGFRSIAWKHPNSRYRPGEPNDDWAVAPIPRR